MGSIATGIQRRHTEQCHQLQCISSKDRQNATCKIFQIMLFPIGFQCWGMLFSIIIVQNEKIDASAFPQLCFQ